jgi:hypothetical protein
MLTRRGFLAAAAVTPFAIGSVPKTVPATMPLKVLLDTDIGSDIDDKASYLLEIPQSNCARPYFRNYGYLNGDSLVLGS